MLGKEKTMELIPGEQLVKITIEKFRHLLENKKKRNIIVMGPSGYGKTSVVEEYAEANGLKIVYLDLAGRLPEEVAGIPYVKDEKTGYYRRMLDEEFKDFIESEGEGYILFIDEINQGSPDTLNTLYSITHPNPKMRRWSNHPIGKCQIVACGNLTDGTDKTVYLTDIPTPLALRFTGRFELKPDNKSTTKYLKEKYKNIPQVAKYIKTMLDEKICPRDIDQVLDIIGFEDDPEFVESMLGPALTAKIYEIQKGIKSLDPAEMLKNAREIYNKFKEDGYVIFGPETISSEDDLKEKFKEFLSDEEIASVFKGGE